ncbi:MAG TPA: hypothetical protein VJO33_11930 [Gemmatimonadaceae bacterium]|nr:hypothetical protein [Gemmatimonadaceae bacterium]
MRCARSLTFAVALLVPLASCDLADITGADPNAPTNLSYQLIPSGDPNAPLGIILSWGVPSSGRAVAFDVYGRMSNSDAWGLRATTSSPSFHELVAELQYYVVANDDQGNELGETPAITVNLQSELPAPSGLHSFSLNSAIQLAWSRNAVDANPGAFSYYRVYSGSFDAAHSTCSTWSLEGSTVSDAFLVASLSNGVTRCYTVSAVSRDGHESNWSSALHDTPRYDARNVLVYSHDARTDSSGFFFYDESAHRYGEIAAATQSGVDFTIERHSDGTLWFKPARADVLMATYGTAGIPDLTSIDQAPASALASVTIEAVPGYGYVFSTRKSDGVHYGAVRVDFVAQNYVVFDWSYQSAAGNVELSRVPVNP